MTAPRWSLAGRLTAIFAGGTLVVVIANAVFTGYFLKREIDHGIEKVLDDEIADVDAAILRSTRRRAAFEELFQARQAVRSDMEFAWRLWNADTGEIVDTYGAQALAERAAPSLRETGGVHELDMLRWRTQKLQSGYVLSVVVDADLRFELLHQYQSLVVQRAIVTVAFAALLSWFVLRRVSRLLREVADSLRSDSGADPTFALADLPREVFALADALRERLARVRAASEQAQLFTAGLAHELRSPIQNLIGETEVALITPRDPATYRAVLESNLSELRELGDAVDNLMTICAQRGTDSKLVNEEFDLGDEAEIRLARERTRGRLLDVQLEIRRSGDTRLVGDREAILRALRNLVGNAIDFSPPNARVEVEIAGEPDEIRVQVDDRGPGVPASLRERIFEPFFTGPAKRGGRVGYGLGLAITRTAVTAQGGRIEVVDNPAGGASFRLHLPRRPRRFVSPG